MSLCPLQLRKGYVALSRVRIPGLGAFSILVLEQEDLNSVMLCLFNLILEISNIKLEISNEV